jgi:molecular chaperone GrpE
MTEENLPQEDWSKEDWDEALQKLAHQGAGAAPPADPPSPAQVSAEDLVLERTADLQRLQAEYANYKKRVDRDRALARQSGVEAVLGDLLPVLDGIAAARAHDELTGGAKLLADELEKVSAKYGLESFGQVGDPFDPHVHEALMTLDQPGYAVISVAQVFQPGYRLKDRVLRPARVGVAEPTLDPAEPSAGEPAADPDEAVDAAGPGSPTGGASDRAAAPDQGGAEAAAGPAQGGAEDAAGPDRGSADDEFAPAPGGDGDAARGTADAGRPAAPASDEADPTEIDLTEADPTGADPDGEAAVSRSAKPSRGSKGSVRPPSQPSAA